MFSSMGIKSYAGPMINTASLEEHMKVHIEKVKLTNPKKYQDMMKRAGGKITDCRSCHIEIKSSERYIPLIK